MKKEEIAKHVFARNPEVKKVFITSDKQVFRQENQAEAHSQRLKDQKVETFEKATPEKEAIKSKVRELTNKPATGTTNATSEAKDLEVNDPEEVKSFPFLKENVGPASEEIKKVSSVEELDAIAAAEKAGEDRTGVRNAIEARRTELTESNTQNPE